MPYGDSYNDRGMVKWNGFYLSEHTENLDDVQHKSYNKPKQKPQMDIDEIGQILEEAQLKHLKIAIQLEEVDVDNNYKPDIVGFLNGYDELGFWISQTKVNYDEIRHVELANDLKWSDTKRFL